MVGEHVLSNNASKVTFYSGACHCIMEKEARGMFSTQLQKQCQAVTAIHYCRVDCILLFLSFVAGQLATGSADKRQGRRSPRRSFAKILNFSPC